MKPAVDSSHLLIGPVAEVVHDYFKLDLMVWRPKDRLVVVRHQSVVVKLVELVYQCWFGHWLRTVIRQPAGDVPIQVVRQGVEEVLRGKSVPRESWNGKHSKGLTVSMLATKGKFALVSFLVVSKKLHLWAAER